ncbi:hypothetical protein BJF82_03165 [Kytococcus sp. CUA-901]|nr:hypothetical protein BJF82_03165 [Kytococcus sp. CUA-901]
MLRGKWSSATNALLTVLVTVVLGFLLYGAGAATLAVGLAKGAWVGLWILGVIWPALLLHHLASRVGMSELGHVLGHLFPRHTQNVLVLAWLLPSAIQGVSGFGVPIAVAAPLLVAIGVRPVAAVALPLIGYHWSVGFGSMGSSFYMAAFSARLDRQQTQELAHDAAILLGLGCLLAGVLVALMVGGLRGLREAAPLLVTCGPVMVVTQFLVARIEPSIGALSAGVMGLLTALVVRWVMSRSGAHQRPGVDDLDPSRAPAARAAAVPFLALGVVAVAVMVPPGLRDLVRSTATIAPSFPATGGGADGPIPAQVTQTPVHLLAHPGTFLLAAVAIALVVWRWSGFWRPGLIADAGRATLKQGRKSSPAIVLLAAVAGAMVDTGMVARLADAVVDSLGHAYLWAVPALGALGSFVTGSTTNSNALFSALQVDVAESLGLSPAAVLAGQLAGGNVGNSVAPVVILMGLAAVGQSDEVGEVIRRTVLAAAVLLTATTLASVLVLG